MESAGLARERRTPQRLHLITVRPNRCDVKLILIAAPPESGDRGSQRLELLLVYRFSRIFLKTRSIMIRSLELRSLIVLTIAFGALETPVQAQRHPTAAAERPTTTPDMTDPSRQDLAPRNKTTASPHSPHPRWAIVIHGGAGTIRKDRPAEDLQLHRQSLEAALNAGRQILNQGGSALDAVTSTIRMMENAPVFNAGRGAVFTHDGHHELDASIMDGRTLACGAVAGVRTVKNPILAARLVMEKTRHVMLVGPGADQFAKEMNLELVPQDYFSTEARRQQLERAIEKERQSGAADPLDDSGGESAKGDKFGTVGCVALDVQGNLAAGTSTGGLTNKRHGRIGDSPIIGAGTYANNKTCGISASGIGEEFIRHAVAFQISALMEHAGLSLQQAAERVVRETLRHGDGGIIGLDRHGAIVCEYTTTGMYRAAANSEGLSLVRIWSDGD